MQFFHNFDEAIAGVDAVAIMLRLQKERMEVGSHSDGSGILSARYGLSSANACAARGTDCLVMHPGPINRGVEIAADVADGSSSR